MCILIFLGDCQTCNTVVTIDQSGEDNFVDSEAQNQCFVCVDNDGMNFTTTLYESNGAILSETTTRLSGTVVAVNGILIVLSPEQFGTETVITFLCALPTGTVYNNLRLITSGELIFVWGQVITIMALCSYVTEGRS